MKKLDDFFTWIDNQYNFEKSISNAVNKRVYGLERMRILVQSFGNPQHAFKSIHVAGSKGKSSTVFLLTRAISASGARVGGFISPHVLDYRERIFVLKDSLDEESMRDIAKVVQQQSVANFGDYLHPNKESPLATDPPTTFELLTLFAFLCFQAARCQWAVIECGLGGRLDATNVVCPAATIITSLELEHTDYLGRSIRKIAFEKAGIIKDEVPVFIAAQKRRAGALIKRVARKRRAPLYLLDDVLIGYHTDQNNRLYTLHMAALRNPNKINTVQFKTNAVLTDTQIENIALARAVLEQSFPNISSALFFEAIHNSAFIGRFDMPFQDMPIVFDGAHTPISLQAALQTFTDLYGFSGTCIFGCAIDKRYSALLNLIAGKFTNYILSAYDHPRAYPAATLASSLKKYGIASSRITVLKNIDAIEGQILNIIQQKCPLLICGSFYLVGALYPRIHRLLRNR